MTDDKPWDEMTDAERSARIEANNRKYREQEEAHRVEVRALRERIFDRLQAQGIRAVRAEYDGEGDSGQFTSCTFIDRADGETDPTDAELATEGYGRMIANAPYGAYFGNDIVTVAEAALERLHPGWEINDGSAGTVTFHVADRQITIDHAGRFQSYDESRDENVTF